MSVRVKEDDFSACFEVNGKVPVELPLGSSSFISQPGFDNVTGNVVHVPGRYSPDHVKLVEGVAGEGEFLEVGYFNSDSLVRRNIPHLQVEYVLAIAIKISVGSLPSLTDGLLVLLLCFFLLLDNALDHCLPKVGGESVDAGLGVDGEAVLHLQEFLSGVVVVLDEGNIGNGIDNVKVVV